MSDHRNSIAQWPLSATLGPVPARGGSSGEGTDVAEPVSPGASGSTPMAERVFGPDRPPGPIVRLPTWVNVVLVLILLASCGGAGAASSFESDAATKEDVRDMCRLLGALAQKQGVDPDAVVETSGGWTACREGLQQ